MEKAGAWKWISLTSLTLLVYDVSRYLDDHPGGRDVLLEVAGADASNDFDFVGHSKSAIKSLAEFEVGSLEGYVNAQRLVPNNSYSLLTQSLVCGTEAGAETTYHATEGGTQSAARVAGYRKGHLAAGHFCTGFHWYLSNAPSRILLHSGQKLRFV